MVLVGVIVQQLIPKADRNGRALTLEIMRAIPAIRNMIRENSLHQIYSVIQMGRKYEMKTMNQSLTYLCEQKIITVEEALKRSTDIAELLSLVKK